MHPRSQVTYEEIMAEAKRTLRDLARAQLGAMLPNPPEPKPRKPSDMFGGFVEINWPPPPPPPAKLERTENIDTARRRLEMLKVPWHEFRFDSDRFYSEASGVNVRIAPSISVRDVSGQRGSRTVRLQGHTASVRLDAPVSELVATARRLAIELFAHELDEWLADAGLCEDPHVLQRFRQQARSWFQRPNWQAIARVRK